MTALTVASNEKDPAKFAAAIQQLTQGRSNAVGSFTLRAAHTTTTVEAINCAEGSVPIPVPTSANAAAEQGAGTMYISQVNNKSFVVTHANNAQTDRTFLFVAIG